MFRLTRLPLRRCLHTAARAPRISKLRAGAGAALVFGIAATAFAPTVLLDTPSEQKPVTEKTDTEGGESSSGGGGGGAYNPETGEINWDCPCLGGMAHGPCGEEFKAAFSCFVHSEDEPKGIDCVGKFQGMQNCFKEHPDIYAADDDDDEPAPERATGESEPVSSSSKQDAVAAPSPASEKAPTPKPRKAPAPEPSS